MLYKLKTENKRERGMVMDREDIIVLGQGIGLTLSLVVFYYVMIFIIKLLGGK
jgi:hypothetical protein